MTKPSEETPSVIYLIPDDEFGHVFCEDPAPNENMDPDAAVKYVRQEWIDRDFVDRAVDDYEHQIRLEYEKHCRLSTHWFIAAGFALAAFILIIGG